MKISIIIPCKKRLDHLKQTLPLVLSQSYEDIEVVVVDYNCPEGTKSWCDSLKDPRVVCVQATVGANEWSLSGARNFGYKHSSGSILFFLDADAKLSDRLFLSVCRLRLVPGSFICGWGWHDGTGCCMVYRDAFELVKGYNEAIKTWGFEDIDFYTRLEKDLAHERRNWTHGIETIKHGDEFRNEFHGGKDPNRTNEENWHIAQNKFQGL